MSFVDGNQPLELNAKPTNCEFVRSMLIALFHDRSRFRKAPAPWYRVLEERLLGAAISKEALRMYALWGFGRKDSVAAADIEAMDFLSDTTTRVASCLGIESTLHLILTDTHATVNQVNPEVINSYARSVTATAECRGIQCSLMSDLMVNVVGCHWKTIFNSWDPDRRVWNHLSSATRDELTRRAQESSQAADSVACAIEYVRTATFESLVLNRRVQQGVLLTYHTPNFAFLLPAVPIIFTFVGNKRKSKRPWFQELD